MWNVCRDAISPIIVGAISDYTKDLVLAVIAVPVAVGLGGLATFKLLYVGITFSFLFVLALTFLYGWRFLEEPEPLANYTSDLAGAALDSENKGSLLAKDNEDDDLLNDGEREAALELNTVAAEELDFSLEDD